MPAIIGKISIVLTLGVLLYIGVYIWGSHSEAFKFVERTAKSSQALRSQIGEVKQVRLDLFGFYSEKHVNSKETVRMTVIVSGALKTIKLNVLVEKTPEGWQIEKSTINEKPISLLES